MRRLRFQTKMRIWCCALACIWFAAEHARAQSFSEIQTSLPPGIPNLIIALQVGNKYVYRGNYSAHGGFRTTWNFYEEIVTDTLIGGKKYFKVKSTDGHSSASNVTPGFKLEKPFYFFKRADSSKIYYYDHRSNGDFVVMDFAAPLYSRNSFGYVYAKSVGQDYITMSFSSLYGSDYFLTTYSTTIGIRRYARNGGGTSGSSSLVGYFIDGVMFGDTSVVTAVQEQASDSPEEFALEQNFPNPFNPSTTIQFHLPRASFVTLKIHNLLGEEIATLVHEQRAAGEYRVQWQAENLPSGVYVYRLQAGEHLQSKKLVLLR